MNPTTYPRPRRPNPGHSCYKPKPKVMRTVSGEPVPPFRFTCRVLSKNNLRFTVLIGTHIVGEGTATSYADAEAKFNRGEYGHIEQPF